jgi:Ca2+/Na+ antiporter
MYDIRQFRSALYSLIVLGMTGFALASHSPGLWVLSTAAVLLNAWLVATGRFRPLPRYLANLVTILALIYVALVVRQALLTPILVVGQFLVFLQIVKLFEQRANRDFAQLLVLSLLLMVAAAISTASLLFGVLLVAYLFLSLYCCLLFHLKVETDHAKQAIGVAEAKLNPATLRQDQTHLSRSMRRLTGFVSAISIAMAIFIFLFFPRGGAGGIFGPLQFRPSQTLTGFNDQMSFQNIAAITQNQQLVAYATLYKDDQRVDGTMPLLLRGTTLDVYHGNDDGAAAWQWTRTNPQPSPVDVRPGQTEYLRRRRRLPVGDGVMWRQEVTLQPTGTAVLFAIAGLREITPSFDARLQFSDYDLVLQSNEPINVPVRYTAVSTGVMPDYGAPMLSPAQFDLDGPTRSSFPSKSQIDTRIEEMARLPEVSGADAQGALAARRDRNERSTALDLALAQNIETYLRSNYSYTLDLTDARRTAGQDPMVAFLYDFKRGHCEYFAGAMTLMCQSLGLQARVVVGFKCDEYNNVGGYYMVRQSHAHAWVEVLGGDRRWHTFDPTSARNAPPALPGLWTRARHVLNYLEFTWANSVIAYDRERRTNVVTAVSDAMSGTAVRGTQAFDKLKRALEPDFLTDFINRTRLLAWLVGVMAAGLVGAVGYFFFERWKLRRRARRIGISTLPANMRVRLARQLGFYDDLMRLLERHDIRRPAHLTPMEFSGSLSFLPNEAFDTIRRLTDVFYRVRFGRTELTTAQQRRLARVIERVDHAITKV